MKTNAGRLPELDGLRGLAALSVFFSHAIGLIPGYESLAIQQTPLRLLWDGASAVIIFFLLSGFVLTLPYVGATSRPLQPLSFILKRFFRLYPAYWCALLVALLLRFWVLEHNHLASLSSWANSLWSIPLSTGMIARVFAMIAPGVNTHGIDPVIWSLVIEMKVSILFPAIIFMVRRIRSLYADALILACVILLGPLHSLLGFIPVFVAGSYLAKYQQPIREWLGLQPNWFKALILLAALAIYGAHNFIAAPTSYVGTLLTAAGSALILLSVLTWSPLNRIAACGPVHFLGAVSYSFYLLHLPILLATTSCLYPLFHSLLLCVVSALALALISSKLIYEVVELPGVRLGNRFIEYWKQQSVVSVSPSA
ncbi:MAG: acyltransferase [Terracidiphilus sp.]|nr:acyltransferase [Terracidiphilus sp.]